MQNGSGTEQLDLVLQARLARLELVHAVEDAFHHARIVGDRRVGVVFIVDGDVVENILAVGIHALHAIAHDDRQFVAEGRLVRVEVRNRGGDEVAVGILMLETFAIEGRAARGRADHETAAARVARQPDLVAHPLEPEHRVVDVEGDGRHAVGDVGRAGGNEVGHGAGLVDALFEELAVLLLDVGRVGVVLGLGARIVELAAGAVDAHLTEETFHAEGARLIGHDGHDELADVFVAEQRAQQQHISLGRGG